MVIKYHHLSSQRSLKQQLGLALRDRRSLTIKSERRLERLEACAQIGLVRLRLGARGARRGAFFELHLLQPTGKLLEDRFLSEGDRELLGDLMRKAITCNLRRPRAPWRPDEEGNHVQSEATASSLET